MQTTYPTVCIGLHHQADIIFDLCPYATAANSRLEQPMTGQDNYTVAEGWVPPFNNHQPSFHKCRKRETTNCSQVQMTFSYWFPWIGVSRQQSFQNEHYCVCVCGGGGGHSIICAWIASLFSINIQLRRDIDLQEIKQTCFWFTSFGTNVIQLFTLYSRVKPTFDLYTRKKKC